VQRPFGYSELAQFLLTGTDELPLLPDIGTQPISYSFIHAAKKLMAIGYTEVVYPSIGSHAEFLRYLSDADTTVAFGYSAYFLL
jgi:hypothetical protein